MHTNRFCYIVSPEAGMAHDEYGDDAKAYLEVKVDTRHKPTGEEYHEIHNALVDVISNQLEIDGKHLVKISTEEYDENQE